MSLLSIKIKIADREYPMKVEAGEESKLRAAGKLINENLKKYKEQFGIDDKQDLLAIAVFNAYIDKMSLDEERTQQSNEFDAAMKKLTEKISSTLE